MAKLHSNYHKSFLRNELQKRLRHLKPGQRRQKSRKITERTLKNRYFRQARKILVYAALPGEVETRPLVTAALRLKKQVFIPRVNLRTKSIAIYRIASWRRDLRPGAFGILEPRPNASRRGRLRELDLILVPGWGFDRKGGRLGRGTGFFDRFLKKAGKIPKIGLAFRQQILSKVPMSGLDVRMDKVLTD